MIACQTFCLNPVNLIRKIDIRLRALLAMLLVVQPFALEVANAQSGWTSPQSINCPGGFDVAVVPAPIQPFKSLKPIVNPVLPNGPTGAPRADIAQFVANQAVAIQLGKALFWDVQVGSDNRTACASCHFQAGADTRAKNQIHPGFNYPAVGTFLGTNYNLTKADFPFTSLGADKTDNSAGSQGVRSSAFVNVNSTTGDEVSNPSTDPVLDRKSTRLNSSH